MYKLTGIGLMPGRSSIVCMHTFKYWKLWLLFLDGTY